MVAFSSFSVTQLSKVPKRFSKRRESTFLLPLMNKKSKFLKINKLIFWDNNGKKSGLTNHLLIVWYFYHRKKRWAKHYIVRNDGGQIIY
jgi:hypothetical protein